MKQNNPLKSALILLENVFYSSRKYNRSELKDVLKENQLSHSDTTLTRLLEFIYEVFSIELTFKTKNGRVEIIDDTENKYTFVKILLLLGKFKSESKLLTSNLISYSSDSQLKNIDWILDILEAIAKRQMLKISYQKFYDEEKKTYLIKPLMLKEYLGRWYLLGEIEDGYTRVFGIERVVELEILKKIFNASNNLNNPFINTIGVNYSGEVQLVKLWTEDYQLKLFETYPIHSSQEILERDAKGGIIQLEVVINYEFEQLLASYLLKVKVLEPIALKERMIKLFEQMKNKYEN